MTNINARHNFYFHHTSLYSAFAVYHYWIDQVQTIRKCQQVELKYFIFAREISPVISTNIHLSLSFFRLSYG